MKRLYCRHFGGIEGLPLSKDCMLEVAEDKLIINTEYMFFYRRIRHFEFFEDSYGIQHIRFYHLDQYNFECKFEFIFTFQQRWSQWGKRKVLKQIQNKIYDAWRI